jgi:hypothetical protein
MTLGNMGELGVRRLIAYCLNDSCRQQASWNVYDPCTNVDAGARFALSKHRGAASGWTRTNARNAWFSREQPVSGEQPLAFPDYAPSIGTLWTAAAVRSRARTSGDAGAIM